MTNPFEEVGKVEPHQHVDGSVPVEVTWGLVNQYTPRGVAR